MRDHASGHTSTLPDTAQAHAQWFPATPDQVPKARHFLAELLGDSPLADDACCASPSW
jgi:hypothetical protein